MQDDEKEKIEKEEEKETIEETTEETEETKGLDEELKKVIDKISKSIATELSAQNKLSTEAEIKKKVLSHTTSYSSQKVKLYKYKSFNKAQKTPYLEMEKTDMEQCAKWFLAMLNKDYSEMKKIYEQMETKLEPLIEGTNAEGGFLVPTILANFLTEIRDDVAVIRPRANVISMTGMSTNQLNLSGIATKPQVTWSSENADKGTSSMTFRQISLTPYKMAAIVTMSTELRDDSPFNMVQLVGKQLGQTIAREEDRVFINGDGVGQPSGIASTVYTLTSIDAGGALNFDHVLSVYYRLPQGYRDSAYWVMNSRTMAVVRGLKDSNNDYLLKNFGFITEPNIPSILGRPVLENNYLASSTILFGDLSNYYIADKGGPKISTSEEAVVASISLWQRNLIGIKIEERIDGELEPTQSFVSITNTGVS